MLEGPQHLLFLPDTGGQMHGALLISVNKAFCSASGEDRLAKGGIPPAGLHHRRCAPHSSGWEAGGPGAAP